MGLSDKLKDNKGKIYEGQNNGSLEEMKKELNTSEKVWIL